MTGAREGGVVVPRALTYTIVGLLDFVLRIIFRRFTYLVK